ncbi:MAG: hypothetical protein LBH79_02900 [Nitrososphaerota archaeon]|jgi:hypothetical protein|nr:hypothetical protein [Nitrososphaerota archaeon]
MALMIACFANIGNAACLTKIGEITVTITGPDGTQHTITLPLFADDSGFNKPDRIIPPKGDPHPVDRIYKGLDAQLFDKVVLDKATIDKATLVKDHTVLETITLVDNQGAIHTINAYLSSQDPILPSPAITRDNVKTGIQLTAIIAAP